MEIINPTVFDPYKSKYQLDLGIYSFEYSQKFDLLPNKKKFNKLIIDEKYNSVSELYKKKEYMLNMKFYGYNLVDINMINDLKSIKKNKNIIIYEKTNIIPLTNSENTIYYEIYVLLYENFNLNNYSNLISVITDENMNIIRYPLLHNFYGRIIEDKFIQNHNFDYKDYDPNIKKLIKSNSNEIQKFNKMIYLYKNLKQTMKNYAEEKTEMINLIKKVLNQDIDYDVNEQIEKMTLMKKSIEDDNFCEKFASLIKIAMEFDNKLPEKIINFILINFKNKNLILMFLEMENDIKESIALDFINLLCPVKEMKYYNIDNVIYKKKKYIKSGFYNMVNMDTIEDLDKIKKNRNLNIYSNYDMRILMDDSGNIYYNFKIIIISNPYNNDINHYYVEILYDNNFNLIRLPFISDNYDQFDDTYFNYKIVNDKDNKFIINNGKILSKNEYSYNDSSKNSLFVKNKLLIMEKYLSSYTNDFPHLSLDIFFDCKDKNTKNISKIKNILMIYTQLLSNIQDKDNNPNNYWEILKTITVIINENNNKEIIDYLLEITKNLKYFTFGLFKNDTSAADIIYEYGFGKLIRKIKTFFNNSNRGDHSAEYLKLKKYDDDDNVDKYLIDKNNQLVSYKSTKDKNKKIIKFGWKAAMTDDGKMCILKLELFENTKVAGNVNGYGKLRASLVKVIQIIPFEYKNNIIIYDLNSNIKVAKSCIYKKDFIYALGNIIEETEFDPNLNHICTKGIHFHLSQEECFQWHKINNIKKNNINGYDQAELFGQEQLLEINNLEVKNKEKYDCLIIQKDNDMVVNKNINEKENDDVKINKFAEELKELDENLIDNINKKAIKKINIIIQDDTTIETNLCKKRNNVKNNDSFEF